jgi:hypothetical protein
VNRSTTEADWTKLKSSKGAYLGLKVLFMKEGTDDRNFLS